MNQENKDEIKRLREQIEKMKLKMNTYNFQKDENTAYLESYVNEKEASL